MSGPRIYQSLALICLVALPMIGFADAAQVEDGCSLPNKGASGKWVCQTENANSPEQCNHLLIKKILAQKGFEYLMVTSVNAAPNWETQGMTFNAVDTQSGEAFTGTIISTVSEIFKSKGQSLSMQILGLKCSLAKCSDSGVLFQMTNIETNISPLKEQAETCSN